MMMMFNDNDMKQKQEDCIEYSDMMSEMMVSSWQQRMRTHLGIDKTKSWRDGRR